MLRPGAALIVDHGRSVRRLAMPAASCGPVSGTRADPQRGGTRRIE